MSIRYFYKANAEQISEPQQILKILNEIYAGLNPFRSSAEFRKKYKISDKALVYGEVEIEDFLKLLEIANLGKDDVFYDLGSGSGKAVIISYLSKKPRFSIGVELIPELVEIANKALKRLETLLNKQLNIEFINDDIRNVDFGDGTVFFVNALCFSDRLLNYIRTFIKIKAVNGARIILVGKTFKEKDSFKLIAEKKFTEFNWGFEVTRIYKKV